MAQCALIVAFGNGSWLFSCSSVPLSSWTRGTQGLLDTPLLPRHEGMDIIPNPLWYRLFFILAQHRARHWQVFLSSKHVYTRPSSLKHPKKQHSYKANCFPFLLLPLCCCSMKLVLPEWGSLSLVLHKDTINCSSCSRALERLKVRGNILPASIQTVEKEQQLQSLQKSVYLVNTWVVIGNFTNDHLQVNYPHTYWSGRVQPWENGIFLRHSFGRCWKMYSKRWLTPLQEILLWNFPQSSCRDILTHATPCENKYVQNELGELLGKEEKCSLPVRAQYLSLPGA